MTSLCSNASSPGSRRFDVTLVGDTNLDVLMYGLPEDEARLRPAMADPEIMLDILSL